MQINLKSENLFAAIIAVGTGAAIMFTEQRWIGLCIIFIGIAFIVFDMKIENGQVEIGSPQTLKKRLAITWPKLAGFALAILIFVFGAIYLRTTSNINTSVVRADSEKETNLAMARRWIKLADDISADLPSMKYFATPDFHPEMAPELRSQLWKHETDESQKASERATEFARIKYRGRLASACDEMLKAGIPLKRNNLTDVYLEDPTLSLVNSFSFQLWVNKLNIEARAIFASYGINE